MEKVMYVIPSQKEMKTWSAAALVPMSVQTERSCSCLTVSLENLNFRIMVKVASCVHYRVYLGDKFTAGIHLACYKLSVDPFFFLLP